MLTRRLRDEQSFLILPTATASYTAVYGGLCLLHILTIDAPWGSVMALLAGATMVFGGLLRWQVNSRWIRRHPEYVLAAMLAMMAINSGFHLILSQDLAQTTNLIFTILLAGYLLPDTRKFLVLSMAVLFTWTWFVLASGITDHRLHYLMSLLTGLAAGGFINYVRIRALAQLGENQATVKRLQEQEQILAGSEAVMKALLERLPAGIVIRDADTRLLYTNQRAAQLLDIDAEATIAEDGQTLYTLEGKEVPERERPICRVLFGGETVENEILGTRSEDGTMTWGLVNAFLTREVASAAPVGVVTFVDITERIEFEQQLRQNEYRLQAILNAIDEGVVAVDRAGQVTDLNPEASALLGIPMVMRGPMKIQDAMRLRHVQRTASGSFRAMLGNQDDEEVPVEYREIALKGNNNELLGRIFVIRDLREALRAEDDREKLDKLGTITFMAGGIAHDFNNLLTAIFGNMSLARDMLEADDQAGTFLDKATDSLQQATHLTRQLLTLAKGSEPTRDTISAASLVRELTDFTMAGSQMQVEIDAADDLWCLDADAGQLHQAFSNLLINARQAAADRGRITIKLENANLNSHCQELPKGQYVRITITDDGPGIPTAIHEEIFTPYFTTKPDGTGLGLPTTVSIINKHNGRINLISSEGNGTTFDILLPASRSNGQSGSMINMENTNRNAGLRILVMDDEDLVRSTEVQLLEHLGHQVSQAENGDVAITRYREQLAAGEPFDLVIMDLTVAGGMGGDEAAEHILAMDPDAKLIIASGYSTTDTLRNWDETGFSAALTKPFNVAQLADTINSVV